jgi:mannose-6-phosphate isomerase-like protein (cupin superfamily)
VSNYTVCRLEEVPDILGDYPGEMRFFAEPLGTEQVAFTYRRMPKHTGGKGGYGHRHGKQEEVYFVISGKLEFKLEDEVIELGAGCAIRVAPEVVRSVWNAQDKDAEIVICSTRLPEGSTDHELVEDFWPED